MNLSEPRCKSINDQVLGLSTGMQRVGRINEMCIGVLIQAVAQTGKNSSAGFSDICASKYAEHRHSIAKGEYIEITSFEIQPLIIFPALTRALFRL